MVQMERLNVTSTQGGACPHCGNASTTTAGKLTAPNAKKNNSPANQVVTPSIDDVTVLNCEPSAPKLLGDPTSRQGPIENFVPSPSTPPAFGKSTSSTAF